MKIKLGQTVSDVITGFKGVATGYVTYITGCNQVLVAPRMKEDGKAPESHWYDEDRLEVLEAKPIVLPGTMVAEASPGPDMPAPIK